MDCVTPVSCIEAIPRREKFSEIRGSEVREALQKCLAMQTFPQGLKPTLIFAAFAAPFDFAQGRLLKSCPVRVRREKRLMQRFLRPLPEV